MNLEEIAENSKIVIDTCFIRGANGRLTKSEIKDLNTFLDNNDEKIIVVPGVTKENEVNSRNSKKGSRILKRRIIRRTNQHYKDKYRQIDSNYYFLGRLMKRLKRSEVDFSEVPFYQALFKATCYLANTLKIKDPEKRTDESIVATAFFLTYCGSKKIAILSNDGDILSLACALIREPKIYTIKDMIKDKQIRIYNNYHTKGDITNCDVRWDSTKYKPSIPRLSYRQQQKLSDLISIPILL